MHVGLTKTPEGTLLVSVILMNEAGLITEGLDADVARLYGQMMFIAADVLDKHVQGPTHEK